MNTNGVSSGPMDPVTNHQPAFIISLDFELMWGVLDKESIHSYGKNILGVREAIPAMLRIFQKYGVKVTWAVVGLLLFDRRDELLKYLPSIYPTYLRHTLNPYRILGDIGEDEKADPYHFGLSLARQILDYEGMELGSHTFSHYYCEESGQDVNQFRADLEASSAAIQRLTNPPISIVFPRNQYTPDHLTVCAEQGFKVFRGLEKAWMYRGNKDEEQTLLKRGVRFLDSHVPLSGHHGFTPRRERGMINCPSSFLLRPYSSRLPRLGGLHIHRLKSAMESAACRNKSFHLWWHPHNFGINITENMTALESFLRFHVILRDRYGQIPMTMGEVARRMGHTRAAGIVSSDTKVDHLS